VEEADRAVLLDAFRGESDENLAAMERGLLRVESAPEDDEATQAVFRAVHTLKASAGVLNLQEIVELAHTLEEQIDRVRGRRIPVTPAVVTALLAAVDALRDLVGRAGLAAACEGARVATACRAAPPTTLRLDARRLDAMLDVVGQIALVHARLARTLEGRGAVSLREADDLLEGERLQTHLQELVLRARLVPLATALGPLARVVRDTARAAGKIARLEIDGADIEVDARIVDELRSPLTHLIANAVDHGIERPGERHARGKDVVGVVRVTARQSFGKVILELSDDGAGLDREAIARRAAEIGIDVRALPRPESVIFKPGFSTAAAVTHTSGRGMGMDVVRCRVEALGGAVDVHSERGVGTTVRLRVPLTMSVLDGFAVGVGGELYIVPMPLVVGCLDGPEPSLGGGGDCILQHRGLLVPCVPLSTLLGTHDARTSGESVVVVVQHGRTRVGLVVDELLGNRPTVVKSLARALQGTRGIAGSAVWGDGRVALILDVPSLLRRAAATRPPTPEERAS
jgi:two-component system chemotaxis sensor kinase CheA